MKAKRQEAKLLIRNFAHNEMHEGRGVRQRSKTKSGYYRVPLDAVVKCSVYCQTLL